MAKKYRRGKGRTTRRLVKKEVKRILKEIEKRWLEEQRKSLFWEFRKVYKTIIEKKEGLKKTLEEQ